MSNAGDLKFLGVILKTHGVDGQLVLKLEYFTEDELIKGEPVFVEIDGIPVPFFTDSFRYLSDDTALLGLDEVTSSTMASGFINCRVYSEKHKMMEHSEDDPVRSDELRGFRVIDEVHGNSGILQEIIEYPDNPVMRLDLDGREILVPFHESIVKNINYDTRVIEISAPDGLFDLYI
ncbi:MAG: ribosome maturation factor RimM [Bacteroidales bacterium]|jgi:16S rRNA processing protein RimM